MLPLARSERTTMIFCRGFSSLALYQMPTPSFLSARKRISPEEGSS
jgi:hypothetical protein